MTAIDLLKHDKRFLNMLEIILAFGNYINGGTRIGCTYGFKLSSLRNLYDVKSYKDQNVTLLHHAVEYIQSNFKDVINLVYEMDDVHTIAKENMDDLIGSINKLSNGLRTIGNFLKSQECDEHYKNIMGRFIPEAIKSMEELITMGTKVQNDYIELLNYYAESSSTKSNEFFSNVSVFAKAVETCVLDNSRFKEEEMREKRKLEEKQKRSELRNSTKHKKIINEENNNKKNQGQLDFILQQMKRKIGVTGTESNTENKTTEKEKETKEENG